MTHRKYLGDDGFFSVSRPVDPEEVDYDLEVLFREDAAYDLLESLWECTAFIDSLPSVDDAVREDRELIVVYGSISSNDLRRRLLEWWRARLQND